MKKLIASLLVLSMVATLFSCGGNNSNQGKIKAGVLTLDNSAKTGITDIDRAYASIKEELGEEEAEKVKKVGNIVGENIHYDNLTSAILGLDRGDVFSLFLPEPVSDYIIKKNPDKYVKRVMNKLHVVLVMAAMKDRQDVIDTVNKGLKAIQDNRKYQDIYKKYITFVNTDGDETIPHYDDAQTIRVAITGDLPPFDYMDPSGKAQGFNVALLAAMGEALHVNFELVHCDAAARAITVSTGKADVVFWMSGEANDGVGTSVDFSEDVPEGMIVSDRYAIVPKTLLSTKETAEKIEKEMEAKKNN